MTLARRVLLRLLKAIWKAFGGSVWEWTPPYEYVFDITAERLHSFLGISRGQVLTWCIVGGYLGLEVPRLLKTYPKLRIDIFECSTRYFPALHKKFRSNSQVNVVNRAVTSESGTLTFFETTLPGSGSILRLGKAHKAFYGSEQAESFEVEAVTLDSYYASGVSNLDVLQIDVQGAEMLVLRGATQTLAKTKAVFVEISQAGGLYENSATFEELSEFLQKAGFGLRLLGSDFNGTGNALFINNDFACI